MVLGEVVGNTDNLRPFIDLGAAKAFTTANGTWLIPRQKTALTRRNAAPSNHVFRSPDKTSVHGVDLLFSLHSNNANYSQ